MLIVQLLIHMYMYYTCVQVLGATFDGASVNRQLVKLHGSSKEVIHKVPNPYATDERELFFSDPPHLVKTTRNCWASRCRNLWVCHQQCTVPKNLIAALLFVAVQWKRDFVVSPSISLSSRQWEGDWAVTGPKTEV